MQIEHEQARKRFVVRFDDAEAELAYDTHGKILDLTHTFVPPEQRGKGVGRGLVEEAFSYAERSGLQVQPTCPFVRRWLERNPERQDLVATGG